jgi:hypothetical protein
MKRITIIGGGASGTLLAVNLIKNCGGDRLRLISSKNPGNRTRRRVFDGGGCSFIERSGGENGRRFPMTSSIFTDGLRQTVSLSCPAISFRAVFTANTCEKFSPTRLPIKALMFH